MRNNWKEEKWVVGVSGGADSMALLDMCHKDNVDVVVCHVNYQKRDTADRDMVGVKTYCEQYGIPLYIKKVESYTNDNFQTQARNIRYAFFREIAQKENCVGVLSAHQEDDVLETYIFQKNSGRIPMHYGINEESKWQDLYIYRPLLNKTKLELLAYCKHHGIPHFMDESNLSDDYERNRIRHHIVEKMNADERIQMLQEMASKNETLSLLRKEASTYVSDPLDRSIMFTLDKDVLMTTLRLYMENYGLYSISNKTIVECIHKCRNSDKHFMHDLDSTYAFVCEYNQIYIIEKEVEEYSYTYDEILSVKEKFFTLASTGDKIQGVSLSKEDFPITIRNARKKDKISLRYGTKQLNRFFIDRKILYKDRCVWPVIVNKDGVVIFVKGIGCDINHYNEGYFNLYLK